MDGKVHHFGAVGYANGLTVLADEETRSLWDHMSGEAFEGPLAGNVLQAWPVFCTTVEGELARHSDTVVYSSSHRSWGMWVMGQLQRFMAIQGRGWIPPTFYRSMAQPIDPRLPKLTQGLGIVVGGKAKYYPLHRLPKGRVTEDRLGKRHLQIVVDETVGTPIATWRDTRETPRQFLSRWYGFSYTYPSCTIYEGPRKDSS